MTHTDLLRAIVKAYSHGACRLFITNAGVSWQGDIIERTANSITLRYPRPIHMAVEGTSDIVGWVTENGVARAVGIEAKTGSGRARASQKAYLALVERMGGRSGVARSVEDAGRILGL